MMRIGRSFVSILFTAMLASPAIAQTYTVQAGDSLWKIAEKTKAHDVTVHQMIAAIHENNSALLGADIGNIKPGMELAIPSQTAASNASSKHATQLLSGTGSPFSTPTRNTRIDSIQKKISHIENEIEDTIEALTTSQDSFDAMVTP
ncbi:MULTISPECIES: type IV pilus assembly protein FimV [unclassified Methylophaga]|jgi:FimV-like protein|uniref:type IV pilus assembly protein FimV n=1 Tax=unclassified Methylophaga TaxID=2629249 RepID=UPI0025E96709|nr:MULTISPECIES: FimV/HubP family polar landmark protein [unclassified Methylophaga]